MAAHTITTHAPIQVWGINLHMYCAPEPADHLYFFERLQAYDAPPDIILANEIRHVEGGCDARPAFINALENATGRDYSYHAAARGGRLVAFRSARFSVLAYGGGDDSGILRFRQYQPTEACNTLMDYDTGTQEIAVQLNDNVENEALVAVSVHLSAEHQAPCASRSLMRMENLLDNNWPVRRMTVVGTDFNKKPSAGAEENVATRQETDKQCWYEAMSIAHGTESCANDWYQYEGSYYDPVQVKQSNICEHWTGGNKNNLTLESRDPCDSGRRRVDFLWVRYESGLGNPIPLLNPGATFERGHVDRGFSGALDSTTYSDHRAVHAIVNWD